MPGLTNIVVRTGLNTLLAPLYIHTFFLYKRSVGRSWAPDTSTGAQAEREGMLGTHRLVVEWNGME